MRVADAWSCSLMLRLCLRLRRSVVVEFFVIGGRHAVPRTAIFEGPSCSPGIFGASLLFVRRRQQRRRSEARRREPQPGGTRRRFQRGWGTRHERWRGIWPCRGERGPQHALVQRRRVRRLTPACPRRAVRVLLLAFFLAEGVRREVVRNVEGRVHRRLRPKLVLHWRSERLLPSRERLLPPRRRSIRDDGGRLHFRLDGHVERASRS
mmetsp:Transcript_22273/g.56261  ORF Transcript_22273/g.56261 Transcript_22273/m.56261 type:complete len:208 (+) Transcript_22273:3592-4215(+)